MAHRTRQRVNLAAWANNSAVLNTEFDAFDGGVAASIDGDAGGIWTPAAPINIGGATTGLITTGRGGGYGFSDFSASMQVQNWPERSVFTISGSTLNANVPIAFSQATTGPRLLAIPPSNVPCASEDGLGWVARSSIAGPFGNCGALADGVVNGTAGSFIANNQTSDLGGFTTDHGFTWTATTGNPLASQICYSAPLALWVWAGTPSGSGFGTTGLQTCPAGSLAAGAGSAATARTVPAGWTAGCGGVKRIACNTAGTTFVVVPLGSYGNVLTSTNSGVTWTERAIGVTAIWVGISWSSFDNSWMIVSSTGLAYRSSDGVTWVAATSLPVTGISDLASNNNLWVASVSSTVGGVYWTTDQAATWKRTNVSTNLITTLTGYPRIIFADNRFMMPRTYAIGLELVMSLRSS